MISVREFIGKRSEYLLQFNSMTNIKPNLLINLKKINKGYAQLSPNVLKLSY